MLAVKAGDPMRTEKLIAQICEAAACSVEDTRTLVESMTLDDIVAMARCASAFMPMQMSTGPTGEAIFLKLLEACIKSAALELELSQVSLQVQPLGCTEPRTVRVVVIPDALSFRHAKSQPLGGKVRIEHGG